MKEMIEVKAADLIGPALDWAVAKAEGWDFDNYFYRHGSYWVIQVVREGYNPERKVYWFTPSTDWSQGGPLIEAHVTALNQTGTHTWWAHSEDRLGEGDTALIAACRAIVAAKLGEAVSIPAELSP